MRLRHKIVKQPILIAMLAIFAACQHEETLTIPARKLPSKKMIDAFTEVQYGNMPLMISVPHGGTLTPAEIPDRTCPGIVTEPDEFTIELLKAIDSVAKTDYHVQPYYVFTKLSRIKIDQNRSLAGGTCNNPSLAIYWNNYHSGIDTCINKITAIYPLCLFIDLHGHGHALQRLELGYLIPGVELRDTASINEATSSVYNLLQHNKSLTINELLSGTNAFGTLMADRLFPTVPSFQDSAPMAGASYFTGGYNTRHYCSAAYPGVFGWQTEANFTGVRDNVSNRTAFAKAFMQSIMQFFSTSTSMKPADFGQ